MDGWTDRQASREGGRQASKQIDSYRGKKTDIIGR